MNYTAYLWVLLAAILWGTTGTAQSFFEGTAHPLSIGAFRLAIGGFSLLIFVMAAKKLSVRSIPWPAATFSAISMALFQPLFFSSVQLTGIAIGTVVTIGSAPVLTGLIEWAALKKRPDRVWGIATLLALAGCVLLFANKGQQLVDPIGIAMALGAGISFAVYALASKNVLKAMEPVSAVAVIFSLSACCLLPFLLFFDLSYITVSGNLWLLIYLGIGATSLSYIWFSFGLKQIPSSSAVTLSLAEPLTAAILGVLVVGEELSVLSWIGVGLLLCGIIVLTMAKRRKLAS
ncbi:DME family drug/metabolite transporter [Planomicrobium stackebrandtii]|uniref:DME family drug/metabolite transporter n=1 Tax=Planomicrobium stackebrandtii TaxID=253160 RepID=A0ABU0GSB5_9BACL|nr:EamA family transporter [Planomicrobium stackebrandtii]MDQ0428188.1 DME family drug/metabolite transporter [Planomicrobium stackebrandtii]